ncbi:MAG: PilT/PilU family type 4a pilus ATPase [Candidatus Omnitrophica bacterium]|nr:PilT/PilU family type 4a pilus ATPase [Candidatus Omnitrophota bacterium]MBU1871711.1 PilT/PilU family type 4a pilus ATPase [Candidatus Omnitrophota bacterium]
MQVKEYLKLMVEKNASDMFLRVGGAVRMRIDSQVLSVADKVITMQDINQVFKEILSEELRDFFTRHLDVDFALFVPEMGRRFRVSIFQQRNHPSIVIRNISPVIPTMEELNLPAQVLKQLALESRGLILLTGTMGSGKSTTIASMTEYINLNTHKHILTIEEPIEFIFQDKNSIINQRELRRDVSSYHVALRAFTLQSPDVIYIGNIRDNETMQAAITAAETGVLVLSTLHTVNAAQSVERIINFFPPYQHEQVRIELSSLLKGIISLRLLPREGKPGRIPAYEIMLLTPTIARLIREGKVFEIPRYIDEGELFGMCSFNKSLLRLVKEGQISEETALNYSDNKDEFMLILKGIRKA